jgi:hypothetical protein
MKTLLNNSAVQIALTVLAFVTLFAGIVLFAINTVGINSDMI